jgi:hypothetical protein
MIGNKLPAEIGDNWIPGGAEGPYYAIKHIFTRLPRGSWWVDQFLCLVNVCAILFPMLLMLIGLAIANSREGSG